MTTAFQNVIDNAATLSISKRKKVGTSVARDGTVKATSLGGQVWQFEVQLPSGPRYSTYRTFLDQIEALDRTTVGQIQLNNTGHDYISEYRGNVSTPSGIIVQYTSGNTVTVTGGTGGLSSGYIFKSGDLIQLGSTGSVYSVVNDVAWNQTTVTLHRPVREAPDSYFVRVGPNCVFDVICVQFPDWTIWGYDQIRWSGPFIFAEAL
jgi:hypothetical protein